ncbi:HigA family addiction module antitoxin [Desulfolutivibrio sulfoxidireducens]|uniref:HigA family addiction module antitoxin n=1 Tax=Desulfolutivibrio sulfoxidireducens TaxID=2773299 RepID=UPI00159EB787|nr:HigA family addiction module antitoxin [Desulfolutivibrio sulfoxidireducens]QLA18773.1 HigA family addiction module antidote protein [Desulfolutivibrio sulfoxidireducens]
MRTPIHPGELLAEDMQALDMSANQLATHLKVPANRITQILGGQRAITADTARRLAQFFGTTPQYWLNLQMIYELDRDRLVPDKEQEILAIPRYDSLPPCRA